MYAELLSTFTPSSSPQPGQRRSAGEGIHGSAGVLEEAVLPLCIGLDGTLVKSNTLIDSVLTLARQNPLALPSIR